MISTPQDRRDAQRRVRDGWLRLLDDSRAEVDEVTIAASLGRLTAEWLAGLSDEMADRWISMLAERLAEIRAGVS